MKAQILTPVGPVFDGDVEGIQMPGMNGGFEVRNDHASLVSLLDTGKLVVKTADNAKKYYAISGGFVEVSDNNIIVMAEEALEPDQINIKEQEKKKEEVERELKEHKVYTDEHKRYTRELRNIKNRIKLARS